ncbi:MAG TPA: NAD-dependent epimerase/dehydratase family protein, partial [Anaerolineales bacterium]
LAGLNSALEIFEGDLRDQRALAEAVKGVDYLFHQAAFVSVPQSMEEPEVCFEINVKGTTNVLEAAREAGIRQVVLASSAAVYGESQDLPLKEGADLGVLSPYAASKQINEVYAGLYTRSFGLPVVALRYFNVYGPRQSPDSDYAAAIPIFIRRLLAGHPPVIFGDGSQRRDFVFVSDVVRANLLAAECPQAAGGVFNICTGTEVSILDLVETLSQIIPGAALPEYGPRRPGDIYRSLGDPGRAAQVMNFRAEVNLAEGLAQTLQWMQENS